MSLLEEYQLEIAHGVYENEPYIKLRFHVDGKEYEATLLGTSIGMLEGRKNRYKRQVHTESAQELVRRAIEAKAPRIVQGKVE